MSTTHFDWPLISVITVVFNGEKHIRSTIESVFIQDFKNYELLVVDGASTDRTIEIVSEYKNQISAVVSERDKGIYDAMNKGIKLAKGEWLFFLNCQDTFLNSTVLSQVANDLVDLKKYNVYCGSVAAMVNERQALQYPLPFQGQLNARNLFKSHFCHQALFVRRSAYIQHGYFKAIYKTFADFEVIYSIIREQGGFKKSNVCIARFDLDGVSSNWRHSVKLFLEAEEIFKSFGERRSYLSFKIAHIRAYLYKARKMMFG